MTEIERKKPGRPRTREAEARPAGEVREAVRAKQRTRRGAGHDPLNIAKDILDRIWNDHDADLQWNTETILGQPDVVGITNMNQQGWEPVQTGMFDGLLDHLAPRDHKGVILYQGLRLDWRPKELTLEARAEDGQNAKMAVGVEEAKLRGGQIEGVTLDTNTPNVRAKTFINKERLASVPIPH